MGRYTTSQQESLVAEAREWYKYTASFTTIARLMGIPARTVQKWAQVYQFEAPRKALLTTQSLKESLYANLLSLQKGEKAPFNTVELVKLVTALEKLSDEKTLLFYMHESFECLTEECIKRIERSPAKQKKSLLVSLQWVRVLMQHLIDVHTKEALSL